MKKQLLMMLMLAVITLCGCNNEPEIWGDLVNKEFCNFDVWAGSGFYFYEGDDGYYCTFMMYGSGVHVAGHSTSKVIIDQNNKIMITLPVVYANGYLGQESADDQGEIQVTLSFIDGSIVVDEHKYMVVEGISNYQYIDKKSK